MSTAQPTTHDYSLNEDANDRHGPTAATISSSNGTTTRHDGRPEYVTLVSNDGFEFHIKRSAAEVSGAVKRMLDPLNNFAEAQTNRCHFENITGVILEKVCEYFYYNEKYKDANDVPDMDFPPEICLELLTAADYLDT